MKHSLSIQCLSNLLQRLNTEAPEEPTFKLSSWAVKGTNIMTVRTYGILKQYFKTKYRWR